MNTDSKHPVMTPQDFGNNPVHSAIGCLAFLRSVCRCGETLHPEDEAVVEKVIEGLQPLEGMLFYTGAKHQTVDGMPRRCRVDLMTPAELAICNAMQAVEAAGADVCLTQAVILLATARERVADYVDATADSAVSEHSEIRRTNETPNGEKPKDGER
jgi:hypothetical protein